MNPFPHEETALATRFGLDRRALKAARADLARGVHWELVRGSVSYSAPGLVRLLTVFKIPIGPGPGGPAERLLLPAPEREVTVRRTWAANRRILIADLDGATVKVRVRDSGRFRPGLVLVCRHVEGDVWELAERLPRRMR